MGGITSFFDTPDALPSLTPVQIQTPGQINKNFLGQRDNYGDLSGFANEINTSTNKNWQNMLSSVSPNLMANVQQLGTVTGNLLQGKLPGDVQARVLQNSAMGNLTRGVGGSNFGSGLTARDLGLTSLDMINRGTGMLGQQMQMAGALNPSNISGSNFLLTPTQVMQRQDQQDYYNNQIQNQNSMINYQNSQRQSGFDAMLGNFGASMVSLPFNVVNNTLQTAGSVFSSGVGKGLGSAGGLMAMNGMGLNMNGTQMPKLESNYPADY